MKYTVFPWCTSITLHKIFGKITQVIKSTQHGNFRNTFPGGTQKLTADFQPVMHSESQPVTVAYNA